VLKVGSDDTFVTSVTNNVTTSNNGNTVNSPTVGTKTYFSGISSDVTPQINAGDQVRSDSRQEVSSIAGTVSSRSDDIIVNKREIKTTVTVGDREIVALGGLLDDNEQRTLQKVPSSGDVPVSGESFKSRGRSHVKTNSMVFIR
ncbi:hypothetical protein OY671_013056, partial [Metschnikowia pulcherrima]